MVDADARRQATGEGSTGMARETKLEPNYLLYAKEPAQHHHGMGVVSNNRSYIYNTLADLVQLVHDMIDAATAVVPCMVVFVQ